MRHIITIFLLFLLVAILSACSTTNQNPVLTKQNYIVVMPPAQLQNCPQITRYPNPETLTDKQVSDIILRLNANNKACKVNLDAVYDYLNKAKQTYN